MENTIWNYCDLLTKDEEDSNNKGMDIKVFNGTNYKISSSESDARLQI